VTRAGKVRANIDNFGGFMLGFLVLLGNLPFDGNGIENRFVPEETVLEAPAPGSLPTASAIPQWLRERIRIWHNEADFLVQHSDRVLIRPDVDGEWLNPKLS